VWRRVVLWCKIFKGRVIKVVIKKSSITMLRWISSSIRIVGSCRFMMSGEEGIVRGRGVGRKIPRERKWFIEIKI